MRFINGFLDILRYTARFSCISFVVLCIMSCASGYRKPADDSPQAISPIELKAMPRIGEKFESGGRQHDLLLITSPSSADPCYFCRYGDIDLMVAVDDDNDIIHISTDDEDFVTPEGVRVGTILRDILAIPGTQLSEVRGWAYIVVLPSGWTAAFFDVDTNNAVAPTTDTPVKWLFMD